MRDKRLTKVLFVKVDDDLSDRVGRAADLTGHNKATFVRAAVIEKLLQLSAIYPELRRKDREAQAA
jgi:predicted DNA-binding protein